MTRAEALERLLEASKELALQIQSEGPPFYSWEQTFFDAFLLVEQAAPEEKRLSCGHTDDEWIRAERDVRDARAAIRLADDGLRVLDRVYGLSGWYATWLALPAVIEATREQAKL